MGTIIKTDVNFGEKYKDSVTGFVGVAVGVVKHQFGCVRILLQPPAIKKEGKIPEGCWMDEDSLVAVKPKTKNPGGPRPNPKRAPDPK